jgi:HEAT repeat protein
MAIEALSDKLNDSIPEIRAKAAESLGKMGDSVPISALINRLLVEENQQVRLNLIETLGEIDRFLCLMHWNSESSHQKINKNWKNLHQICDEVFQGNRFLPHTHSIHVVIHPSFFCTRLFYLAINCCLFHF